IGHAPAAERRRVAHLSSAQASDRYTGVTRGTSVPRPPVRPARPTRPTLTEQPSGKPAAGPIARATPCALCLVPCACCLLPAACLLPATCLLPAACCLLFPCRSGSRESPTAPRGTTSARNPRFLPERPVHAPPDA